MIRSITDGGLQIRLSDGSLAGAWTLEANRSNVTLRTRSMWGMAAVKGTFAFVAGEGAISATGQVHGEVIIDAASINTNNRKRDIHLRSTDFLDATGYPQITFAVDRLVLTPEGPVVSGSLKVREHAQPLQFPVTVTASSDAEVRIDAEVAIDRTDFGMDWNQLGMASRTNILTVSATFTRH
jgi:polyisoprenoid-binding protein YceI